MQFGNPIFLYGLLALPIPVLIHLYFRRHRIRVKFSTTQFFRKREKFLAFRRKLRDILLLMLRTLAILFLVLGLSRPIAGGFSYLTGGGTDAIIILDDTLSMCRKNSSGDSAFDTGRKKAQEILGAFDGGDSVGIIFLSGRKGANLTRNLRKVDEALKSSFPAGSSGSYSAALKQAAEQFKNSSDNPNREIYLISDFQSCQAPSQPYRDGSLEDVKVYFVPVSGTEENLSVTRVSAGSKPKMVNKAMKIEYDVENFGRSERKTELSLEVNGKAIETREISIPAGEKQSGEFIFVPVSEGMVSGSVCIKDDLYSMDNKRHFAVMVSKNVKVLALYQDELVRPDPYFFIRHALDPDGSASNGIGVQTSTLKEVNVEILNASHVVILADIDVFPEKCASLLSAYLKRGGTIISFPGARTTSSSMSGIMDALKKDGISAVNIYGTKISFKAKGITFANDLSVMNNLLQLDYLEWKNLQDMRTDTSGKVLASTGGKDVIVERKIGAGRWIAVACSARNDYCNWPELKSFPVVMVHLIDHAANGIPDVKDIICGNKIRLNSTSNSIDVSEASGSTKINTVKGRAGVYEDTWIPGVITFDGADIKAASLNGDPEESKPEIMVQGRMGSLVIDHEVTLLSSSSAVMDQVDSSRKGSSLAGLFFILLFIIAILEFLIADGHIPYFNPSVTSLKGGVKT